MTDQEKLWTMIAKYYPWVLHHARTRSWSFCSPEDVAQTWTEILLTQFHNVFDPSRGNVEQFVASWWRFVEIDAWRRCDELHRTQEGSHRAWKILAPFYVGIEANGDSVIQDRLVTMPSRELEEHDELAHSLRGLNDSRAILSLAMMAQGPVSLRELGELFNLSDPSISLLLKRAVLAIRSRNAEQKPETHWKKPPKSGQKTNKRRHFVSDHTNQGSG